MALANGIGHLVLHLLIGTSPRPCILADARRYVLAPFEDHADGEKREERRRAEDASNTGKDPEINILSLEDLEDPAGAGREQFRDAVVVGVAPRERFRRRSGLAREASDVGEPT